MRDTLTWVLALAVVALAAGISGQGPGARSGDPRLEVGLLEARKFLELGQPSESLLILDKLTQEGGASPALWQARCETLLRMKRAAEAERLARHWIEKAPEDGRAHFMLGVSLVDRGLRDEGLRELSLSAKWGGEHEDKARHLMADLHMERGLEDRNAGRWVEARASMERAVKLDPSNPGFHKALGQAYMHLQLWPEALDEFEQAVGAGLDRDVEVDLHDDIAAVHQQQAAVYLCREDFAKAQAHAKAGLMHATTRTATRRFKGLLRTARQLETETLRLRARSDPSLWSKVLERVPGDPEALWGQLETLPPAERQLKEESILEGPWGGEARVRLARRHWDKDPLLAFHHAEEARSRLPLERALEWEEELFRRALELPQDPGLEPWSQVWNWGSCRTLSSWEVAREAVESRLQERYYVWIYCVESGLKMDLPAARLSQWLHDIHSLDPPARSHETVEALDTKVKVLSR